MAEGERAAEMKQYNVFIIDRGESFVEEYRYDLTISSDSPKVETERLHLNTLEGLSRALQEHMQSGARELIHPGAGFCDTCGHPLEWHKSSCRFRFGPDGEHQGGICKCSRFVRPPYGEESWR